MEDELVLFAAQQSRFIKAEGELSSGRELEQVPLILRETGSGTRTFVQKNLLQHLENTNVLELGNSEAIKQAVINDLGVGCLSRFALQDLLELKKIQLLSIADMTALHRPLYLLENKKSVHSEAYNKFVGFVFDYRF